MLFRSAAPPRAASRPAYSSKMATARVQPAEAPRILCGKQEIVKPSGGSTTAILVGSNAEDDSLNAWNIVEGDLKSIERAIGKALPKACPIACG